MADDNHEESTNESSNSINFNGISPFKQGKFQRGRGNFNSGRGNFNLGRGNFNLGRGNFNKGRGNFIIGRGNFKRGRDNNEGNRFPRSPEGNNYFGIGNSSFEGNRESEGDESFSKRRRNSSAPVSEISELCAYYKQILFALHHGVKNDSKATFVSNALEVSAGEEVALCTDFFGGHCIESLLNHCEDNTTWRRFMTAFASERLTVISNFSSSVITEMLISHAIRSLQNWEEVLKSPEDSKDTEFPSFCLNWLSEFGDFVMENLSSIADNVYSSHVVCSLLCAFAGDMSELSKFCSKKFLNREKHFNDMKEDPENLQPVVLTNVPNVLMKKLKNFSKVLLNENIKEFLSKDFSDIIVRPLFFALKKRWPNCLKQFVLRFSSVIFEERNSDGVPVAFLNKTSLYTVEAIFRYSDEEVQQVIWETYFSKCLEHLIHDRIGNFLLQRIFDAVESKAQFKVMSKDTMQHFNHVLDSRNYGIFRVIAAACNKHSAQQAKFTKSMLQCLNCVEPEQQKEIVPLILSFKPFGTPDSEIKINPLGPGVLQLMLKFQKPQKLVESFLSLKPEEISNLAMDLSGHYAIHSYFGSESVGEENKDKFVELMQSNLPNMITNGIGSNTLCKIWVLLSIKNRHRIIESLIQKESTLMRNHSVKKAMKKLGAFLFKNDYEKWKIIQTNLLLAQNKMSI